jgi:hypothetical protein
MLKIHHAAIDGVSLASLVATLHDDKKSDTTSEDMGTQGTPYQIEMWNRANMKN